MAAVGYTDEEKESAMDCGAKKLHSASLTLQSVMFDRKLSYSELESPADDEIVKCIARWNSARFPNASHMNKAANNIVNLLQQATAASTLNLQDHCERRTLRIGRAGSTESVAATSGGESCQSSSIASDSASEPSSPSRPVTPQPMPPVPAHLAIDHCHYECLRADSEDSGFGPSPAKSSMGPSSPLDAGGFSVSPIQFVPEDDEEEEEEDLEDDDDELSPDGTTTSLLDLTTSRKSYFTSGVVVSDHEDIGCPKGFLPYSVSKITNSSDEFQEKNTIVQQNSDVDSSDGFRFCLPCNSDSAAESNTASPPSPPTDDNLVVEQKVSDFQFLMTSASRDGCPPSDSNFAVVTNTVSDASRGVVLTSHQTLSELPPSPTSPVASLQPCAESKVGDHDAEDSVVSSLTADGSSCVQDDVSAAHRTTEDVTCSSLLASTDANPPLEEISLVRIKVETVEDDENKCQSSTTHNDTTTFLDPKFVLGRNAKRAAEEAIGVVVDPCDESSQDLTRSELCRELRGECTSSSCSQTTTATDSQSTISTSSADDNTCKWLNCDQKADANVNSSDLVDHLRKCHVQTQFDDSGSYVCLWVGCKVYERPSSSRSWLERHVLLHGGSKPFRCIVDGCRQRFRTEGALQRHVNSHFPQNPSSSNARNAHGGKNGHHGDHGHYHYHCCGAICSGPNGRLLKRKRQKCRRRPHSVKTNDFFDDGIMEQVRHSLFELSSIEGMDRGGPPAAITFHSTVIARRTEGSGKTKVLLHWDPEDLLPDSWVSEEDVPYNLMKTIPICSLPPETLVNLDPVYSARLLPRPGKRRRK